MKLLKRYLIFIVALIALLLTYLWDVETGARASNTLISSGKEMMFILPPVFIMLGLLDVWVPRETMSKFMGEKSGIIGVLLAFFLGSAAAGPLYVAFPVAAAFMKKDVKFFNILILIGAWSATKIPMLLFEYSSLGPKFTLTRLSLNIVIILSMAFIMNRAFNKDEISEIYDLAEKF